MKSKAYKDSSSVPRNHLPYLILEKGMSPKGKGKSKIR